MDFSSKKTRNRQQFAVSEREVGQVDLCVGEGDNLFFTFRLTCVHLPYLSKYLYVGSDRGNVHIVQIENFALSGYVINWNKAIDV